jgi:hypothetical protein
MPKVFNIPRFYAQSFRPTERPDWPEKFVWISISEPGEQKTIISNPTLDKLPKLKISFWDLKEEIEYDGKLIGPPDIFKIAKLVNFLVKHKDKSVIVNCAAGVSRSGAVAKFCQNCLNYEWPVWCQELSLPNEVIYEDMVKFYQEKYEIH